MTDKEVMQMALDLENFCEYGAILKPLEVRELLRAALAQPEPEPVAYLCENAVGHKYFRWKKPQSVFKPIALYTAPPQREWQGLTDEEMLTVAWQAGFDIHEDYDNEDEDMSDHWWTGDGEQCDETLFKLRDLMSAKLKEKNS